MNQLFPSFMLLFLFGVFQADPLLFAQEQPKHKDEKPMLECRVTVTKKTTDPRFTNEIALLQVELKNVSDKAVEIVYTSAPAILQYMRREDRSPDGTVVKSNCKDYLSPYSRSVLKLNPNQSTKFHFGTIGGVGPGVYQVQATFEYEKMKAVSPILRVELKSLKN